MEIDFKKYSIEEIYEIIKNIPPPSKFAKDCLALFQAVERYCESEKLAHVGKR